MKILRCTPKKFFCARKFADNLQCTLPFGFLLYENGYQEISEIANASVEDIKKIGGFDDEKAARVVENAKKAQYKTDRFPFNLFRTSL